MSTMDSLERSLVNVLRNKAPGTIAIFERNDFSVCYDEDAHFIASNVFYSEVGLKKCRIGGIDTVYHILNNAQYMRVIRDALLVQHYRVEVYSSDGSQWELKAKGSLGCLNDFEEIIGDSVELSELTAVAAIALTEQYGFNECIVSLVSCNVREMHFTIAEFTDTEHFVNLEKCLAALVPRECIVIPYNLQTVKFISAPSDHVNRLNTALQKAGIKKEPFQFCEQIPSQWLDDVTRIIDPKYKDVHLSTAQKSCIIGLMQHLHLSSDGVKSGKFRLLNYKSAGYMYLNSAAVKALELFSTNQEDEDAVNGAGSLYELLNKCRTPQGKRLLREWLRRPLSDARRIVERLDVIQAFVENSWCRSMIHDDILRRIPDITALARKLVQNKAGLQDCYRLYQVVCLLKRFHRALGYLHDSCDLLAPSIHDLCMEPLAIAQVQFEKYAALIETTLDLGYFKANGRHRIIPSIDENLLRLSQKMENIEKQCESLLGKVCAMVGESVKLDNNENHGYHFRVTLKAEKSIRQTESLYVLETTKGSGVRFTCDRLLVLSKEHLNLCSEYEELQKNFIVTIVETCSTYATSFRELSDAIAVIDTLVSLSIAATSSASTYVRPQIYIGGPPFLELKECRHPVLEANPDCPPFIANDIILGHKEGNGAMFLMLTGANMGGKSTYLRSCAITVLLAQIGSFVPCKSAKFTIIDGIHTRIGSCDYQCRGVSTFMAEMNDCATILESATSNSLIIVDELGRGTSTYDGFGLAWAIAEDIVKRLKCFCIYATHYHELTDLSHIYPKQMKNVCTATEIDNEGELILLYKIVPGTAGRSFGLNIGKMVGLPDEVLKVAKEMLEKLESEAAQLDPDEEKLYRKISSYGDDELRQKILEILAGDDEMNTSNQMDV